MPPSRTKIMPIYALSKGQLLGRLDQQVSFVHQFVHHLADPDLTQQSQMLSDRPQGGSHSLGGGYH